MCEEQGFVQSNSAGSEEYTLGGMSDSTYEYLPKEWLLLGAQVDKYRTMYEEAIEVVKKNLLFRPMVPGDDDILFSGKLLVGLSESGHPELEAENAHLTCFAGGMFGMGAKIFNRPDDLDIAKKLTEGCIWSYDMTATGIMPEAFISVPCKSMEHCKWNETKYWDVVDPYAESRLESYERQMKTYEEQMVSASAWYEAELAAMTAAPTPVRTALTTTFEAVATPTLDFSQVARLETGLKKRQLAADPEAAPDPKTVPGWRAPERKLPAGVPLPEAAEPPTPVQPVQSVQAETSAIADPTLPEFPVIYSPAPPLTHEEYVKRRIENERLPLGVTELRARSYILR
jgi:mannosyl-oligosaccharide alpha-1,2-mannosidase